MKQFKKFKTAFGTNELGLIDFPYKISSVKISRIQNTDKMGGCPYCFPHGIDCTNSRWSKNTRSWKTHRQFQYNLTFKP